MYLRYGAFSYLPPLTDDEIAAQVRYALLKGWPVSIEHSTDPHPRNIYCEVWGLPLFDLDEPDGVMAEINACRSTFPEHYVRVLAYDASLGRQTTAMQFLVQRPGAEQDLVLTRTEGNDRTQTYGLVVRRTDAPGPNDGG
jgi:ribulose-bisphosphate carboxylase small chain